MRELAEKYAWADTDYDLAWTVAVIQGSKRPDIVVTYGGQLTMVIEVKFWGAMKERNEHFDEYGLLQLVTRDDAVVAIEPNGWTGNVPEIARRASENGGRFFSVYWSPSAFQILQATNGQVTGCFDPNFIGLPAGAGDLLPGWVRDDDFPQQQLRSSCLAAMEQQTGVAFQRGWLDSELPTYRIPDPDVMLSDVEGARVP